MFFYGRWDVLHVAVTFHNWEPAESQKSSGHTSNERLLTGSQAPWDVIWSKSAVFPTAHKPRGQECAWIASVRTEPKFQCLEGDVLFSGNLYTISSSRFQQVKPVDQLTTPLFLYTCRKPICTIFEWPFPCFLNY